MSLIVEYNCRIDLLKKISKIAENFTCGKDAVLKIFNVNLLNKKIKRMDIYPKAGYERSFYIIDNEGSTLLIDLDSKQLEEILKYLQSEEFLDWYISFYKVKI